MSAQPGSNRGAAKSTGFRRPRDAIKANMKRV
jgi:hypothetical protein